MTDTGFTFSQTVPINSTIPKVKVRFAANHIVYDRPDLLAVIVSKIELVAATPVYDDTFSVVYGFPIEQTAANVNTVVTFPLQATTDSTLAGRYLKQINGNPVEYKLTVTGRETGSETDILLVNGLTFHVDAEDVDDTFIIELAAAQDRPFLPSLTAAAKAQVDTYIAELVGLGAIVYDDGPLTARVTQNEADIDALEAATVDANALVVDGGPNLEATTLNPALKELASVYGTNRPLDLRQHYGGIGDGSSRPLSVDYGTLGEAQVDYPAAVALTDETDWAALQSAIDDATGPGDKTLVPRNAVRPVVIPFGSWLVNRPARIESVLDFSLTGEGNASRIRPITTVGMDSVLDLNGTAYSTFENFMIEGADATATALRAIWLRWNGVYRSSTANTFRNLHVRGTHYTKAGVEIGDPANAGVQVDNTSWFNVWVAGDSRWHGSALSDPDVEGFIVGEGTAANNLLHHFYGCVSLLNKYGVHNLNSGVGWHGGSIQSNWGSDLRMTGPGPFTVDDVRSELSAALLTTAGTGGFPAMCEISNYRFTTVSVNLAANNRLIDWQYAGNLTLRNVYATNPGADPIVFALNSFVGPVNITLDGVGVEQRTLDEVIDIAGPSGTVTALAYQNVDAGGLVTSIESSLPTKLFPYLKEWGSGAIAQSILDAVEVLNIGDIIETAAYWDTAEKLAGGNKYRIVAAATGTVDGGSYIDAGSRQLEGLFVDGTIRVSQFGVRPQSFPSIDGTTEMQNAVLFAQRHMTLAHPAAVVTGGRLLVDLWVRLTNTILVEGTSLKIDGLSGHSIYGSVNGSGLIWFGAADLPMLEFQDCNGAGTSRLGLIGNDTTPPVGIRHSYGNNAPGQGQSIKHQDLRIGYSSAVGGGNVDKGIEITGSVDLDRVFLDNVEIHGAVDAGIDFVNPQATWSALTNVLVNGITGARGVALRTNADLTLTNFNANNCVNVFDIQTASNVTVTGIGSEGCDKLADVSANSLLAIEGGYFEMNGMAASTPLITITTGSDGTLSLKNLHMRSTGQVWPTGVTIDVTEAANTGRVVIENVQQLLPAHMDWSGVTSTGKIALDWTNGPDRYLSIVDSTGETVLFDLSGGAVGFFDATPVGQQTATDLAGVISALQAYGLLS